MDWVAYQIQIHSLLFQEKNYFVFLTLLFLFSLKLKWRLNAQNIAVWAMKRLSNLFLSLTEPLTFTFLLSYIDTYVPHLSLPLDTFFSLTSSCHKPMGSLFLFFYWFFTLQNTHATVRFSVSIHSILLFNPSVYNTCFGSSPEYEHASSGSQPILLLTCKKERKMLNTHKFACLSTRHQRSVNTRHK